MAVWGEERGTSSSSSAATMIITVVVVVVDIVVVMVTTVRNISIEIICFTGIIIVIIIIIVVLVISVSAVYSIPVVVQTISRYAVTTSTIATTILPSSVNVAIIVWW